MTALIGMAVPGSEDLLGAVLAATPMPDLSVKQSNGAGIGDYPASFGVKIDNAMGAQATESHNGFLVPTYGNMFYGRIYIDPLAIDLGTIASEQVVELIVFNGHLDASKVFSAVNFSGGDGISIDYGTAGTPPMTMTVLQELHYSLKIGMIGPASIACTISWDFADDEEDAKTVIIGSRIAVWPLPWKRGATETIEWLTDILMGDNGTEQRISLRQSPRQSYQIESRVPGEFRASLDNLLYEWRHRDWGVPIWPEATRLVSPVSIGDTTFYIDALHADYAVGGKCLIYRDYAHMFVGTITSTGSTWITTDETFSNAFPVGVWVMPLKSGVLKDDPEQSSHGGNYPDISATFLLTESPTVEESEPAVTYNGIDVETGLPSLAGGNVKDTWARDMKVYDFEAGVRRDLSTWETTRKGRAHTQLFRNRADIWAMRRWLMRRRGRAVPFYQPTYQKDMVLTDLDGVIGNFIICADNYHPTMGYDRVNLAFFMADGSVVSSEVTGSDTSVSGTMALTLAESINLARSDIKYISYMGCKRLASDSVAITWIRTNTAELDYSIVEIRP